MGVEMDRFLSANVPSSDQVQARVRVRVRHNRLRLSLGDMHNLRLHPEGFASRLKYKHNLGVVCTGRVYGGNTDQFFQRPTDGRCGFFDGSVYFFHGNILMSVGSGPSAA